MPIRINGGVFDQQILTGSLSHWVICGADFSGAINSFGQPVPNSAAEIIFKNIEEHATINIMNPNDENLSFALEEGRSIWDEISLTVMVQSLGTDVGVDHINCSVCTVKRVPYVWGCGASGPLSFLELTDTPDTYAGSAGYVVTVNPGETGLIFSPAPAGSNAFSIVTGDTGEDIVAVGASTLNIVGGTNVSTVSDPLTNTITINATNVNPNLYIPVSAPTALNINEKYFVTNAGTVTLPILTGLELPGISVRVAKKTVNTVTINVGAITNTIDTDLGSTDSIIFDATQEVVFLSQGTTWQLQIGSTL